MFTPIVPLLTGVWSISPERVGCCCWRDIRLGFLSVIGVAGLSVVAVEDDVFFFIHTLRCIAEDAPNVGRWRVSVNWQRSVAGGSSGGSPTRCRCGMQGWSPH